MDENLEAMQLAVRVLTALNEGRDTDPDDVQQLRAFAAGHPDDPIDELACEVMQMALNHRVLARVATLL